MPKPPRGTLLWKIRRSILQKKHRQESPRAREIRGKKVRIPRRLLVPIHRRQAKGFSVEETRGWTYEDRFPHPVQNMLFVTHRDDPHLVLRDRNKSARFTLRYQRHMDGIIIRSVQRERTPSCYERIGTKWVWNPEKETMRSKEFQKQLGMQPAEFLVCEFIFQHRNEIQNGTPVAFILEKDNPDMNKVTRPLLDRFFKIVAKNDIREIYKLNPDRRRVKEILSGYTR